MRRLLLLRGVGNKKPTAIHTKDATMEVVHLQYENKWYERLGRIAPYRPIHTTFGTMDSVLFRQDEEEESSDSCNGVANEELRVTMNSTVRVAPCILRTHPRHYTAPPTDRL